MFKTADDAFTPSYGQDIACSPRVTAACWHGVGTELALVLITTFFPNAKALPQPAFAATASSLSPV